MPSQPHRAPAADSASEAVVGDDGARRATRARSAGRRARLPSVAETSAGGLVLDAAGPSANGLLIGRRGRQGRMLWAFPKGHLEEGETAEQAALREVREETGIDARIIAELGTIDFWFVAEGRRIHKTVHHFLMEFVSGDPTPADGEVDEVAWAPLLDLPARLAYRDERDLLVRVPRLLAEAG